MKKLNLLQYYEPIEFELTDIMTAAETEKKEDTKNTPEEE